MKPAIKAGAWWALVRGTHTLPVLFATRQQARENCEPDERIVRVWVTGYQIDQRTHRRVMFRRHSLVAGAE